MRGQQPRHSRYVAVGKVWFLDGSRARLPRAILAVKAYFFCSIQTSKGNDRPQPPGRTPATQPCLGKLLGITLLIFFFLSISWFRACAIQLASCVPGMAFPLACYIYFEWTQIIATTRLQCGKPDIYANATISSFPNYVFFKTDWLTRFDNLPTLFPRYSANYLRKTNNHKQTRSRPRSRL